MVKCGRPTRKGTPCTSGVLKIWNVTPTYLAPACGHHLTDQERAAVAAIEQVAREGPDPACWGWPAPAAGSTVDDWGPPGICAMCGGLGGDVEDHCHRTGLVRGRLCRGCNVVEGANRGGVAAKYRRRPPAVIVGWTRPYGGGYGVEFCPEPEPWVVDALGSRPADPTEAARYLEAATRLSLDNVRKRDNPLKRMGL
jgi:hypothetical protein